MTIDPFLSGHLATVAEASVSDDSIEPLKTTIRALSEKQQQVLYCWMHEELDCRRFKD
jgi:hypothetical protein